MPSRILYDTICTSQKLGKVSDAAEVLYYRLLVKADDYGRFYADADIVQGECVIKKKWKPGTVEKALQELHGVGLIILYMSKDERYLVFEKWRQRRRADSSRFPDPAESDVCGQVLTNDSKCQQMPAYNVNVNDNVNGNVNVNERGGKPPTPPALPEPEKPKKTDELPPGFGAWYELYPKHVARGAAVKAWLKLKPDESLIKFMCTAVRAQITAHEAALQMPGAFVPEYPNPATWLNGQRWLDEIKRPEERTRPGEDFADRNFQNQRTYTKEDFERMKTNVFDLGEI
jgi:hypothetical protein